MRCDLSSMGILVTRADHQAEPLCRLIEASGGRTVRFPVLEIQPQKPDDLLKLLNDSDILIFISPNSVHYCLSAIDNNPHLINRKIIAAVGQATASALEAAGISTTIVPQERADSEALLAHDELQQVEGKQITIVRGAGGRALLGDTLLQRGAIVRYAEVYKRLCPTTDNRALLKQWPKIQVVTSTSIEMLNNLVALLGEEGFALLKVTPLLVISSRMQQSAKELGFQHIILSKGASDQAIMAALCQWKG